MDSKQNIKNFNEILNQNIDGDWLKLSLTQSDQLNLVLQQVQAVLDLFKDEIIDEFKELQGSKEQLSGTILKLAEYEDKINEL